MDTRLATIVWWQALQALWLALAAGGLYRFLRPDPVLRYWGLSWAASGLGLVAEPLGALAASSTSPSAGLVATATAVGAAAYLQPAFLTLAALHLHRSGATGRAPLTGRTISACLVLAAALPAAVSLVASSSPTAVVSWPLLAATGATAAWFAVAFSRHGRDVPTAARWIVAGFSGLYAAYQVLCALAEVAGETGPGGPSAAARAVAASLSLGLSAGVVVWLLEEVRLASSVSRAAACRLRTLLDEAPDTILVVTPDGRIAASGSRDAAMRSGRDGSQAGPALADLVSEADRARFGADLRTALERGDVWRGEYAFVGRAPFLGELLAAPVRHEDRLVEFIVLIRDTTDRRRAEDRRAALEAQLQQSQKLESLGRLTGGIAHDFNNLLTVINGYGHLLLESLRQDDPLREHAESIMQAGERAADITRQLLAFTSRQVRDPKVMVLNDVILREGPMLRRLIREDVDLVTELDPAAGQVLADPSQLTQVLLNLIVNARDAVSAGGRIVIGTARIEWNESQAATHPDTRPGSYALLSVRDNGIGMDAATRYQIFDPFFTTKQPGAGTGLGLTTVHGIVRQLGGWIQVASQPGLGTTFRVFLPRVEGLPSPSRLASGGCERLVGSETVLIAEDQAELRRFEATVLRSCGYTVLQAGAGDEALMVAELTTGSIDLLVADVIMPGMTGPELARRLQTTRPGTKVLYTSGYSANIIAREGVLDAGVMYLAKPFTATQLASRVRAILDDTGAPPKTGA